MSVASGEWHQGAVATLIAAIDDYLARFQQPGVADVRAGIARWRSGPIKPIPRSVLPACDHLDPALDAVSASGEPALANAIAALAPLLAWVAYDAYPRADIGAVFADGHAFASLIGEGGFLDAAGFDLGLFLIAPNVLYRDHHHAAPELYAPLTGPHGWRFAPGDRFVTRPAHVPVWNEPWQPHATLTGNVPLLCIYCWTRDVNDRARVIPTPDWATIEKDRAACASK